MLIAFCIILILIILLLFPLNLVIDVSFNKMLHYKCLLYIHKIKAITIVDSSARSTKEKKKNNIDFKKVLKFLSRLKNKPIKPGINVSSSIDFNLSDAAFTAMLSAILNSILSLFYFYIRDLFFVKEYKFHTNPNFSTENYFIFNLNSSISFNLLKLIYFYILFKKYGGESLN